MEFEERVAEAVVRLTRERDEAVRERDMLLDALSAQRHGMSNRQVAWAVALCARAVVNAVISSTNVLLSDGRDAEAGKRLLRSADIVGEVEELFVRRPDGK